MHAINACARLSNPTVAAFYGLHYEGCELSPNPALPPLLHVHMAVVGVFIDSPWV